MMSWLEDYLWSYYDKDETERLSLPPDADLDAWVEYVDEGMDFLGNDLSFLRATQEDADIGEEVLDA